MSIGPKPSFSHLTDADMLVLLQAFTSGLALQGLVMKGIQIVWATHLLPRRAR